MQINDYVRYSEAFKQQVVSEIESGKFSGAFAASRAYGIKGSTTVTGWLRRYGRDELIAKQITVSTMQEKDQIRQMRQRVGQLEKALADAHMNGMLQESYLEMACERLEIDVEEFKKKHVTGLSAGQKAKAGR